MSLNLNSEKAERRHTFYEKYGEALKTCILPMRCAKNDKEKLPNSNLGLFSFVSLGWMSKIMWRAARHRFDKEDVKAVNQKDGVDVNHKKLALLWNNELERKGQQKASFVRTVWCFNRTRLTIAALMMIFTCVLQFVGPAWILKSFLDYLEDDSLPISYGVVLIILLSLTQFLKNAAYNSMWIIGAHAGVRVQAAIQMLVYNKVLTTKMCGDKLLSEVVNYCTTDIERIYQSMQLSMMIAGAPVMWILNVVYCYLIMGPWSLFGNILILVYYPIMGLVAKKTSQYRVQSVKLTDSRISLMSQVLSSIKLIKMYAWEDSFSDRIQEIRRNEEAVLSKAAFLQSFSWSATPIVVIVGPMVGFIGMVLCGDNLTSSVAFTVISVFTSLQLPLYTLPMAVKAMSEGIVSCRRIQRMLLFADATQPNGKGIRNPMNVVSMVGANLAWPTIPDENENDKSKTKTVSRKNGLNCTGVKTSQSVDTLYHSRDSLSSADTVSASLGDNHLETAVTNVNLIIPKGFLVGICGNVGSGKSTLLAGISGEAAVVNGEVSVRGSVALASQQAWIFNATLRDNITFGLDYDKERYERVVEACCLTTDFALMPNGDMTEIGEKGANLSGGQKQRVNLARSLYSDRDLYLLDDTLSAVDVKVGKHIFNNCIKAAMKEKTVLLVTHAVHHLEQCDYILLMKDGKIAERGTHSELISLNGDYCQMFTTDKAQRETQTGSNEASEAKVANVEPVPDEGPMVDTGMIKEEVDACNGITWKTCLYFSKASGGYFITFLAFLTIVLFNAITIFNSIWLQTWLDAGDGNNTVSPNTSSNDSSGILFDDETTASLQSSESDGDEQRNPHLLMYVIVYGVSAVLLVFFGLLKALTVGRVILKGASKLHYNMFWKVIRSPMEFFDTTPLARIVNRFSRDIDEMDVQIPFQTEYVTQTMMLIMFQIILIGVLFPFYFIAVAIVFIIYITMDLCLNGGVRETKRVDNLLRPPILVHISATVQGLSVIRCYMKQKMFIDKFRALVDKHLSAFLVFQLASKWLSFRVDILSWITVTATAVMILLLKGSVSSAVAGLALSQIFRVCSVLATVTRWKSELLARLISIERVTHYCKNLSEEAPAIVDQNRPNAEWPTAGSITFNDVHLRYRQDLPNVLHGLTVHIKGGEKVGIIGRTGAGKSSVIGSLLRLNELSGGSIIIDGVDISKIGLKDLRSNIAVIPQEPVLFEGTIRWNLDPFNKYTDEEIWSALEKAHLKAKVCREARGLATQLTAEGGSFSLGEKQLFCLGRALLRNSKILLLDEATASVDVETDKLIQETIRKAFSHCTVLTIAHRLNTITDYEKIMTMDAGKVIEFDTPLNLLSRDSVFNSMMKAMSNSAH